MSTFVGFARRCMSETKLRALSSPMWDSMVARTLIFGDFLWVSLLTPLHASLRSKMPLYI